MQPVGRSVSVCWPTLMPSTAVMVWLTGAACRADTAANGSAQASTAATSMRRMFVILVLQNVGGVLIHNSTASCFDGLNQRCPSVLSNQKLSPSWRT